MEKHVTLADVAEATGVSKSTVSYVLSGKKSISKDVENAVHQAIDKLGYVPRITTPKLFRKPKILSFCIPLENEKEFSSDPFYLPLIEGAYEAASKAGYAICINPVPLNSPERIDQFLLSIPSYDGIILMLLQASERIKKAIYTEKIPCVIYGTPELLERDTSYYVDVDNIGAGYQVTRYLASKGHKKILYMEKGEKFIQTIHHVKGYKIAHKEAKIPWDDSNVINLSSNNYQETVKAIITDRLDITAFVVASNILARSVLSTMRSSGISFPGKKALMVVGGNLSAYNSFPRITTIDFQPYLGGITTVNLLIDIIEGRMIQPTHILIPGKLVELDTV